MALVLVSMWLIGGGYGMVIPSFRDLTSIRASEFILFGLSLLFFFLPFAFILSWEEVCKKYKYIA